MKTSFRVILFFFIMVVTLGFPVFSFSVELREEGESAEKRILLENEFLRVRLLPAKGGRVESMTDKRKGGEVVPKNTGLLLDMFSVQNYPGEMINEPYEYTVVQKSADAVVVKLWRKATGRGGLDVNIKDILVEKTVWLKREEPFLVADYKFINKGDDDKIFTFWSQQFLVSGSEPEGDIFLRPGVAGISEIPYPGGKGEPEVLTAPSAGWSANVDPKERSGTVVFVNYNYLRWFYNAVSASTVEWLSDPVMLPPGGEWNTLMVIAPFSEFDTLPLISPPLVVNRQDWDLSLTCILSVLEGKTRTDILPKIKPPKIKQYPKKPAGLEIIKDDKIDLLFLTAPGFSGYNLKELEKLIKPGTAKWSYYATREFVNAREMFLGYFPADYKTLFSFDAVIFAGIGPELLEDYAKAMLRDYLETGGKILVLGGLMAMNGWTGKGNVLSEILPIENPEPFQITKLNPPAILHPAEKDLQDELDWNFRPVIQYLHNLKISKNARVLMNAGRRPVMVERKVGKGRIIVFMGTAMGDAQKSFWKWKDWPNLLAKILS